MAFEINNEESIYEYTSLLARQCGIDLSDKELAYFASEHNYGRDAIAAIETLFDYLAKKQRQITIESMFRFSRLPQREPKTFENFDFDRIQGKDIAVLKSLLTLTNFHARKKYCIYWAGGNW